MKREKSDSWLIRPAEEEYPIQPSKEYPLQDVEEPNLHRNLFPYSEVPKVSFDGISVPIDPAPEIWITDTTFRDGQQARPPYTVEQIVHIYDLLHKLSGPNGVIRQCEFFLYSDKDREAVEKCLEKGYRYPEITGWIRAIPADFELVKTMGLSETGMLTSISDYHVFMKFRKSRQKTLDDFMKVVEAAAEAGLSAIRCHFEDITRADFWGSVIPFAQQLKRFSEDSGLKIKVRLCDTMGYGVPWPEAALPRSVPKIVHYMRTEAGYPPELLEWHGHNDFHKVHVNPATAWLYGCAAANGALLGFGERTGNSPIEALCIEYAGLMGSQNGMDFTTINEIAEYFRSIDTVIPHNYPFVGEYFNVTSAGIHADGVIKNQEIYNIFDTDKILGRPLGVVVTDKSGIAGIAMWINLHFRLEGDKRVEKRHPGIKTINEWVTEQYKEQRTTGISPDEMLEQVRKFFPELIEK